VTEELREGTVFRLPSLPGPAAIDRATGFPAFLNPRWISHLGRVADEFRPTTIIVRDIPLGPTAIWEGRRRSIPVVLDMAENYPAMIEDVWKAGRQRPWDFLARNPAAVRRVERYCLEHSDGVLVVVEESRDRVVRMGVPAGKVAVVSNTPPMGRVKPRAPREPDPRLTVVYLGLMEIPRGVGELIAAVRSLLAGGAGVRLRLIGDGRDRDLLTAMVGPESREQIEFLGYVDNAKALELVSQADIGVVPHHANESWNTTIPNKLFDYMAAGLPVITSDAIPAARIVRETRAGEVFRSGDSSGLASAIRRLSDPTVRRTAGEAGQAAILGIYNWEADTARLVTHLAEVTSRR